LSRGPARFVVLLNAEGMTHIEERAIRDEFCAKFKNIGHRSNARWTHVRNDVATDETFSHDVTEICETRDRLYASFLDPERGPDPRSCHRGVLLFHLSPWSSVKVYDVSPNLRPELHQ
jgi:hypothetical protein